MEPRTNSPSSSESDTILIPSPTSPRRDDEFYCRDIIFQVEDVLFKVARRPFEQESTIFNHTFQLLSAEGLDGECEGETDDNSICLNGVTEEEFRAFLRVMFRPAYGVTSTRNLSKNQWTHVLKLSTMWSFEAIRDKAIAELTRLVRDPVTRIVLARKYHISGWTEPALLTLAQQDALAVPELEALGWDTVAKLIQVRESIAFTSCSCGCMYCSNAHGPIVGAGANQQIHTVSMHAARGPPRPASVSVAAMRKSYDFTAKIREVFGAELQ